MAQESIDLSSLEDAIVRRLKLVVDKSLSRPFVKEEDEIWTSDQCASYLGIDSVKSFTQHTASLPTFPERIELPTARSSKRGQLRWRAVEVKEWALSHRKKRRK